MKDISKFQPDTAAWRTLTKEKVQERKKEWKCVQRNLKVMAYTMFREKSYLSAHKQLFFKGELPESDLFSKFSVRFLLFYLWYYPDFTPQKCREILELFATNYNRRGVEEHLEGLRHDIIMRVRFSQHIYPGDYGLMGGREEFIIPELMGIPGQGAFFDVPNYFEGRMEFYPSNLVSRITGTSRALVGADGGRYVFGQYMWPHAAYSIKHYYQQFPLDENLTLKRLRRTIAMLVHFDDHPKTAKDDPYAKKAKNRVYAQIDNGEIDGPLLDWIDEIKQNGWEPYHYEYGG